MQTYAEGRSRAAVRGRCRAGVWAAQLSRGSGLVVELTLIGDPDVVLDQKTDFDRELGAKIRASRERVDMSQDELARRVGLSRTSVTNIEGGRQGVQAYLLVRIAEALECSAIDLLPAVEVDAAGRLPEQVKQLDESRRAWAERVLGTRKSGDA